MRLPQFLRGLLHRSPLPSNSTRRSRPPLNARSLLVEPLETRALLSTLPAGFQEDLIATDVEPTGFDFAPDGRMFVANKSGTVAVIHADGTRAPDPFFSVPVDTYRDRGLTAVLVDPNYAQNHFVYVYYTLAVPTNPDQPDNGATNRLVRLTASEANPDIADPTSAVVLLNDIPSPTGIHQGGFFEFGADGMLYAGIGEGDIPQNAQDLSNISGKVLRLDAHNYPNIVPADNPFVNQVDKRPEIWAYGFRNPFSGNVRPSNGQVFVNDVGQNTWEEANVLVKGGNYGWPTAEGPANDPRFVDPLFTYNHNNEGAAIVGGTFCDDAGFPAGYFGQYFAGDLVQGLINKIDPDTGIATTFASGLDLPTDVDFGPDGSLYWSSIGPVFGAIYKISYVGNVNRPPLAVPAADITSGGIPLTVNFDASLSTDPDGDPLLYAWDFGDGTTATGIAAQHTYDQKRSYNVVLTVSDRPTGGLRNSATIVITVGNHAPQPTITTPLAAEKWVAGQTVNFAGAATDFEDGPLDASQLRWSFKFGHNTHLHDFVPPIERQSTGSFFIPQTGETDPDQYYRIFLTATDSEQLSATTFVDLRPVTTTITVNSNIAGATLLLDGQTLRAGPTTQSVAGMLRTIEAPLTQTIGTSMYRFVGWSDGGAADHTITTPLAPATYTAQYQKIALAALYASTAPQQAQAGQKITYQVTLTNVGSQTWRATGSTRVRLGVYFGGASDAVGDWIATPVRISLPRDVAATKSITLSVTVTAPTAPGTYVLRNRLIKETSTWFDTMDRVEIQVASFQAGYQATPPTLWATGQRQQYSITLTNRGSFTWRAEGHERTRLGVYFGGASDAPPTGTTAAQLFDLPNDVAPGQSVTMTIDVFGPANAGKFTLRQRLFHEQLGWCSEMLRTAVTAEKLSAIYSVSPPTQWQPGETKTYSVTLQNNGSTTWKAGGANPVHLGVYFAGASDEVGDWPTEPARYNLPRDVAPGQKITLTLTVQAPLTPGNYTLRHRLVKEFVNWFSPMKRNSVTVA